MVGTENRPYHSVVWVTVGKVQLPRTLWTYWLSEGMPGGPSYEPLLGRGNPTDMLCYSYTELSTCLRIICGYTPPPPGYFTPTPEELDEGAKWIVRAMPFTIRSYRRSLRIASLRSTLISSEVKHWVGCLASRLACAVVEMKWLWGPYTALSKRVLGLRVPGHPFEHRIDGAYTRRGRSWNPEDTGNLKQHRIAWLTDCEAIAESDVYVKIGHPEDQVILLKATLLRAAAEGVDWREIYRAIYDQWHTRRPHFPDLNTMAAEIDPYRSRTTGT